MRAETLLLVEDDDAVRKVLARALVALGFDVSTASSGEGALELARAAPPRYAVLDLELPDTSGLELLVKLRTLAPDVRVLLHTGVGSIATAVEATRRGAIGYLTKPAAPEEIARELRGRAPASPVVLDDTPTLAVAEWELIQRVLLEFGGDVTAAAKHLDIHPKTLRHRLRKGRPQE